MFQYNKVVEKNFRELKHFQEEKVGNRWDSSEEREQKKYTSKEMHIIFGCVLFRWFYMSF